jgi:hypothetical protein
VFKVAQVLSFPGLDTRQQVRDIVVSLTQRKIKHNDMMIMVADILNWYHITKLDLGDFTVRLIDYYKDLPIVIVECKNRVDGEYCPVCGSGIKRARYMHTNKEGTKTDLVSWSCLDCGTFYETESQNGEGMKC